MGEVILTFIVSIISAFIILPLMLVAFAFTLGLQERVTIEIDPFHHLFRMMNWAYEKGSGER